VRHAVWAGCRERKSKCEGGREKEGKEGLRKFGINSYFSNAFDHGLKDGWVFYIKTMSVKEGVYAHEAYEAKNKKQITV
jgi:hypothetical protein